MIVFRAQELQFHLDTSAGQLWRGQERVHLAPREWEVLRYFAENAGRLVSKEELHQKVWAKADVGPAAQDRTVSNIRKALGDRADDPLFIETVHGRGYRFVAQIEDTPASLKPSATQVQNKPTAPAVLVPSAFRLTDKVDVFRVKHFHRWPYESAVSSGTADPFASLPLNTSLVSGTKYRCYSLREGQSLSWGLVGHNYLDGENFQDSLGNSLSSRDVQPPEEIWIQVEYVLYHSTSRADDKTIDPFRRRILAEGLTATSSLGAEAPDQLTVGTFNDPWYRWYELCDRTTEPQRTLFISAITDLQYINAHSIPDGDNYHDIFVSIYDYRSYKTPPLVDLTKIFDRYNAWFRTFVE